MKNAKIGFLLLSVFAFQNVQAKKENPQKKAAKAVTAKQKAAALKRKGQAAKTAAVVQDDAHKVEVTERPLLKKEVVAESVSNNYTEQPDGTVIQTQVTVTPMPEENKVVTTTETWTLTDAFILGGKVFLGAAAAAGVGYLAYNNSDAFKGFVDTNAQKAGQALSDVALYADGKLVDAKQYASQKYAAGAKYAADKYANTQESLGYQSARQAAAEQAAAEQAAAQLAAQQASNDPAVIKQIASEKRTDSQKEIIRKDAAQAKENELALRANREKAAQEASNNRYFAQANNIASAMYNAGSNALAKVGYTGEMNDAVKAENQRIAAANADALNE